MDDSKGMHLIVTKIKSLAKTLRSKILGLWLPNILIFTHFADAYHSHLPGPLPPPTPSPHRRRATLSPSRHNKSVNFILCSFYLWAKSSCLSSVCVPPLPRLNPPAPHAPGLCCPCLP